MENWKVLKCLIETICISEVQPEVNPKWEVLSEILIEINILAKDLIHKDPTFNNKVLILVEDSKTCSQLKQVKMH